MPVPLAAPGFALAIVAVVVAAACAVALVRIQGDPEGSLCTLAVMIVLTLTMAGGVVACEPTAHGHALHPHVGRLLGYAADVGRILDGLVGTGTRNAGPQEALLIAGGHGEAVRPPGATSAAPGDTLERFDGAYGDLTDAPETVSRPLQTSVATSGLHRHGGGKTQASIPADAVLPHRGRARRMTTGCAR